MGPISDFENVWPETIKISPLTSGMDPPEAVTPWGAGSESGKISLNLGESLASVESRHLCNHNGITFGRISYVFTIQRAEREEVGEVEFGIIK